MYPEPVNEKITAALRRRPSDRGAAVGAAAAVECGTHIKFTLAIDDENKTVTAVEFRTDGCGYMLAAAETLAGRLEGTLLADLHGLRPDELISSVKAEIYAFPSDRAHCVQTVVDAVREAFADHRRKRIGEFVGERALICTCFGVSEDAIEIAVRSEPDPTVDKISRLTKAGTGCGSCLLLVDEIIDSAARHR